MLFKISVSNIRKSLRDYTIYFFTLIIGISIFYVFNAVETQTVYLEVSQNTKEIIKLLTGMLSGVSVFVAMVLGLLIVYASRFLMKRRNGEFALYMVLGMSKSKISAILLLETFIIGIGSLCTGILIGIGLSQIMSALVANLFEANMTSYTFAVSGESIVKTVIYFGIMYVMVMLFNSVMISRCKLIDLMQSGKKSEKQKLKDPFFCTIVFIIAAAALGYAYYKVAFRTMDLEEESVVKIIVLGAASTFLLFWSVSGLLLHIFTSMKSVYFSGLNCFTFRQVSSKINTMVMSMTVICLMLFVAICTLSSAFSIRNSMNANLNALCPADVSIHLQSYDQDSEGLLAVDNAGMLNIAEVYEKCGYDITDGISDYVHLNLYNTEELTLSEFCGDRIEILKEQYRYIDYDTMEDIVALSDYNRLMELYGRKPLELEEDEYILLCDFGSMKEIRDMILADGVDITVFGHRLTSKYEECQNGFIDISSQHLNIGIFVVPDSAVKQAGSMQAFFIGNYGGETREDKAVVETQVLDAYHAVREQIREQIHLNPEVGYTMAVNTKIDISEATIGLGALVALLGLYIGLVFLISCGVILALKELSESVDSIQRYIMLRKIGAEERDISKSLFHQTGIFFLLPLLLAGIHSVFGMKFSLSFLEIFGTEKLTESVIITSVMILLIYGGYFLITYFCSKSIIREKG